MHGATTFYAMLAVPVCAGSLWVMSRRRLAYSWRSNATDSDHTIYPRPNEFEVAAMRTVRAHDAEEYNSEGKPLAVATCPGLVHRPKFLTSDEAQTLLSLVRGWAAEWGVPLDSRVISGFKDQLESAGLSSDFVPQISVTSGIIESSNLPKTPWGSGDSMKTELLPPALRYVSTRIQEEFPFIGELRNVSITYYPTGEVMRTPKAPVRWNGHDYVLVPLIGEGSSQRRRVVTFSPLLRSGVANLTEVLRDSWTSQDIDVLLQSGSALRVYGRARFQWGWGMRPGPQWFGHCSNVLDKPAAPARPIEGKALNSDGKGLLSALRKKPDGSTASSAASQQRGPADVALMMFCFEGPFGLDQNRRRTRLPESMTFGYPPSVDDYAIWRGDIPDETEVRKEGLWWFVSHFADFLRS